MIHLTIEKTEEERFEDWMRKKIRSKHLTDNERMIEGFRRVRENKEWAEENIRHRTTLI